jgi:hypothetical protein
MKITQSQLKKLIKEELLISENFNLQPVRLNWDGRTSSLTALPDNAEIEIAKKYLGKAEELVDQIGKSANRTKKILNSPLGRSTGAVTASALFGLIKKYTNKLSRPIQIAGEALDVLNELRRISLLINRGVMSPATALELFGTSFVGHAADQAISILSLGVGGIFGPVIASALEPLTAPLHDRVNELNNNLDAAAASADWMSVLETDPELLSAFGGNELPDEIIAGVENLSAPEAEREYLPDIWQSQAAREETLGSGGKATAYDGPDVAYTPAYDIEGTLPNGVMSKGTGRTNGVVLLQRGLALAGVWDGGETGVFDSDLKHAIRSFQRETGITPDGIYGPNTKMMIVSQIQSNQGRTFAESKKLKISRKDLKRIISEELSRLQVQTQ